jgi:hypothetical protein
MSKSGLGTPWKARKRAVGVAAGSLKGPAEIETDTPSELSWATCNLMLLI